MSSIEKIYQMRRNLLVYSFLCSLVLFVLFGYPKSLWPVTNRFPGKPFFEIAGAIFFLLLLILLARYVSFRTSTLKDPALRKAVDDERIRLQWLRAYRAAFYVIVGIHLLYIFLANQLFEMGFPHVAWLSFTAGVSTFFGAAIFYTREIRSEH